MSAPSGSTASGGRGGPPIAVLVQPVLFAWLPGRVVFGLSLLWTLGASTQHAPKAAASPGACPPMRAGLDTTHYNWSYAPFLGHAQGETFYAPDTLITKITVWRPPGDRSYVGAHLYVTAVDSTSSTLPFPDTQNILLDGPTILVIDSDPPGQLIEMPFMLDPPLALPRRALYAWLLQAQDCNQGAVWDICADTLNDYPEGMIWYTGRATSHCFLAPAQLPEEEKDFVFEIEFCDMTTPTRRLTWGRLKILYR